MKKRLNYLHTINVEHSFEITIDDYVCFNANIKLSQSNNHIFSDAPAFYWRVIPTVKDLFFCEIERQNGLFRSFQITSWADPIYVKDSLPYNVENVDFDIGIPQFDLDIWGNNRNYDYFATRQDFCDIQMPVQVFLINHMLRVEFFPSLPQFLVKGNSTIYEFNEKRELTGLVFQGLSELNINQINSYAIRRGY